MTQYADTSRQFGSVANREAVEARMTYATPEALLTAQRVANAELAAHRAAKDEAARVEARQERAAYVAKMVRDDEALAESQQVRQAQLAEQERRPQQRYDAFRVGAVKPASDRSVAFLVSLAAERTPQVTETAIRDWAAEAGQRLVSAKIDELKKLPKVAAARPATPATQVPAGRYAITGNEGHTVFVQVDRPTEGRWAGRTFVKVQAGDELIRQSATNAHTLLAKIEAAGVQDAMLRYGREIGSCGHCGRTLTNDESRAAGIGPVCRGKLGW